MTDIPVQRYLENALQLTKKEKRLVNLFEKWLPNKLVDIHAHSNLKKHVKSLPKKIKNWPLSTFPAFSIQDSQMVHKKFHPKKEIYNLHFPQPYKGIMWEKANEYLLKHASKKNMVAICGNPNNNEHHQKTKRSSCLCFEDVLFF